MKMSENCNKDFKNTKEIPDNKKLNYYIGLCLRQAYESEMRDYDSDVKDNKISWYYIVVGNQLLYTIKTPYARVSRKVCNRIEKNIDRHFQLTTKGCFYLSNQFDINFTTNKLSFQGKDLYLQKVIPFDEIEKGNVFACKYYEDMCMAYNGISLQTLYKAPVKYSAVMSDISWGGYVETYKRVYDKVPMVDIRYTSLNITDVSGCN